MNHPLNWRNAVLAALRRQAALSSTGIVSREELIENQLEQVVAETQSTGTTPAQTMSRVLQELRDEGLLEFVDDKGCYRLLS